ncbi:MAG: UvrB/UvrC motif-containing protein [candidate division Zixibacteria bacterium]
MLCQDCKKTESTVHLTQILNNKKVVLNLCKNCAEERGFHSPFENLPFPLAEFVSGMVGSTKKKVAEGGKTVVKSIDCAVCGMTFEDFAKTGRLGCVQCYSAFRKDLTDLLRKIHGSCDHRGKIPAGTTDVMKPVREERRLREDLKRAIEQEDFEKAADLRDKIRVMAEESR